MSRRLKVGAVVLASLLAGVAPLARAADAPAAKDVPTFTYDMSWPKPLPNSWVLGNVVGVAVDARDHIWIIQRPSTVTDFERAADFNPPHAMCCKVAPPVIEFDQAGNLVQAWGGPGAGYEWPLSDDKPASAPFMSKFPVGEHTVFIDHKDHVWLGGNGPGGAQILKFTRDGKFLLQIGHQGQSKGSGDLMNLKGPAGIDTDPATNEVFVADGYGNRRVIVFDADTGAYKRHWGAYGKAPDDTVPNAYVPPGGNPAPQFNTVHCVRLSRDGLLYVCDRNNNRIQVFKKDGTFVKEAWVAKETIPPSGVTNDIAFSPDAEQKFIYIIDGENSKVWILRRSTLEVVGSFGRGGHFPGNFTQAHNLATDSKGNIYVGESLEGKRVQRFVPSRTR